MSKGKCPHIPPVMMRGEENFRNASYTINQSQTESSFDVTPNKYFYSSPPEDGAEQAKTNDPLPNDLMRPG